MSDERIHSSFLGCAGVRIYDEFEIPTQLVVVDMKKKSV